MNKQTILTIIITVAILALIGIVIYIFVDEYQNKQDKIETGNKEVQQIEQKQEETKEEEPIDEIEEEPKQEEYVGKEEDDSKEENTQLTTDEKVIQLAKKQWGEDDKTVTYNIEEKKGNIYYVAVKSNAQVISWYEVNIENWSISEFY